MTKDELFIEIRKKAMGEDAAKKMLSLAKKSVEGQVKPTKVYLNIYGNEVHVNGDVSASLSKGETLQEKIARFDRLSAQVSAIRLARQMGVLSLEDDDEEDIDVFSTISPKSSLISTSSSLEKSSISSSSSSSSDKTPI